MGKQTQYINQIVNNKRNLKGDRRWPFKYISFNNKRRGNDFLLKTRIRVVLVINTQEERRIRSGQKMKHTYMLHL
jgi:hypothetical protein